MLRKARHAAGLTKVELAARLKKSQSFVSTVEVGETRVDVIQPRTHLKALGTSMREFVAHLDARPAASRG
jgi:ribosome-binding protein aMBF1 (putative translation factor)